MEAAEELGVPVVFLWTASGCSLLAYVNYPTLIDKDFVPLKGNLFVLVSFLHI